MIIAVIRLSALSARAAFRRCAWGFQSVRHISHTHTHTVILQLYYMHIIYYMYVCACVYRIYRRVHAIREQQKATRNSIFITHVISEIIDRQIPRTYAAALLYNIYTFFFIFILLLLYLCPGIGFLLPLLLLLPWGRQHASGIGQV